MFNITFYWQQQNNMFESMHLCWATARITNIHVYHSGFNFPVKLQHTSQCIHVYHVGFNFPVKLKHTSQGINSISKVT